MRNMVIEKTCIKCKTNIEIRVNEKDYENWKNGALLQRAMPYLTADERELLISNICGPCFDKMFG